MKGKEVEVDTVTSRNGRSCPSFWLVVDVFVTPKNLIDSRITRQRYESYSGFNVVSPSSHRVTNDALVVTLRLPYLH